MKKGRRTAKMARWGEGSKEELDELICIAHDIAASEAGSTATDVMVQMKLPEKILAYEAKTGKLYSNPNVTIQRLLEIHTITEAEEMKCSIDRGCEYGVGKTQPKSGRTKTTV